MQLYLIRHPAPQVAEGVCYGRTNLPLMHEVGAAAARIRPRLPTQLPFYTSPLQRCRQLAEALHPQPRSDLRVQEMNFGIWEMQPWDTVSREALTGWASDPLGFVPPQGESVGQLQNRVLDFVAEIGNLGLEAAVLVTHAGVMKAIVGHVQKLPAKQWMALKFEYEAIVSVDIPAPETAKPPGQEKA